MPHNQLKKFIEIKAPVKYLRHEKFAALKINARTKYLISTMGRVYSYVSDRILKGRICSGVLTLDFTPADKNNIPVPYSIKKGNMKPQKSGKTVITIQKLVALTFFCKPPGAFVVIHRNYDKLDNSLGNLIWISKHEMIKNSRGSLAYKDYTTNRGFGKKVTSDQVLEIKELLKEKIAGKHQLTIRMIAEKYNVSQMQVFRIQNGDVWAHVGEQVKVKCTPKKLSPDAVHKIKVMLAKGETGRAIAKKFGIDAAGVSRIKLNKYYRNIS